MDSNTPEQDKLNLLTGNENKSNINTIEQLKIENQKLIHIIKEYNFTLKEYRKKYGDELFNQRIELMNKEDVQIDDFNFKKQLLEAFPIFKEYEIIISHFIRRKR